MSGLAVSIRLSKLNYHVTILDTNDFTGGKLTEFVSDGYRFDAGPSLFTMPHLVEDLYKIAGKSLQNFRYRRLEEICRYFYPDGSRFTMPANVDDQVKTLHDQLGEDPDTTRRYLDRSRFKYETIGRLFLERSLRKPSTFFNHLAWRSYLNLPKLGLMQSLHHHNEKVFRNPKTVQLFDRYATYNGSDPYQTPAVMSMIPHLELGIGAYFPESGMHQITTGLESLARELGVDICLGSRVTSIILNKLGAACGVETGSQSIPGDIVVSAIDVNQTYVRLLAGQKGPAFKELPKSTSAVIFYWGIRKTFNLLGLHNIFFSTNYKAEFDSLFKEGQIPEDPTIYLNISAKERLSDAPPGCENWFVMVNAPANEGQPWDEWIPLLRKKILMRLSREMCEAIEPLIETELMLEPRSLEARTGAVGGALYGSNSNDRFSAFLRHANVNNEIPHLYFCGGTVHPGGGIPLALQSAAIAARYVAERE